MPAIIDQFQYCKTSTQFLKKIMYNRMKGFIERHNLLSSSKHGFRGVHSTEHAILDMV